MLFHNVQENYLDERYVTTEYYTIFFEDLLKYTISEPYIKWHWCLCHFRCSHWHYVLFTKS
jgi:hypothetical protein